MVVVQYLLDKTQLILEVLGQVDVVLEYLQLLVVMVFLVEVIDITVVVAELVLGIMVNLTQEVLVEKVVVVLVKVDLLVQLQGMQEQLIPVVAVVE